AAYRASDLAERKEVRTVQLKSALWTARGWFNVSYTATVQTTYAPALDIWAFPIEENETWNVSSNATIHAMIAWRFDAPNDSFGFWHDFDVTVPFRLMLHWGELENVTSPVVPSSLGRHLTAFLPCGVRCGAGKSYSTRIHCPAGWPSRLLPRSCPPGSIAWGSRCAKPPKPARTCSTSTSWMAILCPT